MMDKVLHLNGSIRGKLAISKEDIDYGLKLIHKLKDLNKDRISSFVYPIGHLIACEYHVARGISKQICRQLYVLHNAGIKFDEILIDFSNLITNLLFLFSLEVNRLHNIKEEIFISKSY